MEKNNESISIQIANKRSDVTAYKNGGSSKYDLDDDDHLRGETSELRNMVLKRGRRGSELGTRGGYDEEVLLLEQVLNWISDTRQNNKGYNIITDNCQNFAKELWVHMSRFSSRPQPFPDYVNNLEDEFSQLLTGGAKGLLQ